jgi:uncharacterized membrane protein YbhN (UPF0104 family)
VQESATTASAERRRRIPPWLRLGLSAVMLVVLVSRVHLSTLLPTDPHGYWLMALALVVTVVSVGLSALRWQRVLAALALPAHLVTLTRHYLASLFVGNFLPSTIGGDVVRVTRLSSTNGEAPATFASVVLERLTGWVVLPVLTLCGLLVNTSLLGLGTASRVALTVALLTLVVLFAILYLAGHPRVGRRLAGAAGWRRFLSAVHLGTARLRHRPRAVAEVLSAGFAYQLALTGAAFLAARALGIGVGWTVLLAFFPVVAVVQLFPLTVGGLGAREGAFVLFLHPLGVATDRAIALGLALYGLNLAASLLGAPAFAFHRVAQPAVAGPPPPEPADSASPQAELAD